MRGPSPPAPKAAHVRRCYLLGVRDKATVEKLWKMEQARRRALLKPEKKRGRRGD